jgi:hypothetical protein
MAKGGQLMKTKTEMRPDSKKSRWAKVFRVICEFFVSVAAFFRKLKRAGTRGRNATGKVGTNEVMKIHRNVADRLSALPEEERPVMISLLANLQRRLNEGELSQFTDGKEYRMETIDWLINELRPCVREILENDLKLKAAAEKRHAAPVSPANTGGR